MVAPPPTPKLIWLDQLRRTNTLTLLGEQGVKGGQEPEISPPPILQLHLSKILFLWGQEKGGGKLLCTFFIYIYMK